jgi:hypothetical protein
MVGPQKVDEIPILGNSALLVIRLRDACILTERMNMTLYTKF